MPATFRAVGTFEVANRRSFVIRGAIESGLVKIGMKVRLGTNSLSTVLMPIDGVEFIDYIGERRTEIGLCRFYRDTDELAALRSMAVAGEVLNVVD